MPWIAPEIVLTGYGAALLVIHAAVNPSPRKMGLLVMLGLLGALAITFNTPIPDGPKGFFHTAFYYWNGLYRWDLAAKYFKLFFLVTAFLVTWLSMESATKESENQSEFYILPLFVTAGLCTLASVNDFILLFVSLELVTISFYILVSYQRSSAASLEAGVKFLIMGGVSSAFLVMGIAYIFGTTGSTQFPAIASFLEKTAILQGSGAIPVQFNPLGLKFGMLMVLVGLGFKAASVPFHVWAPDVYQGAPSPITAFLSVGSKAAGFIALLCIVIGAELYQPYATSFAAPWTSFIEITAILSMLLGNLAALPQRNLKRMLAYSSIGHTGFLLIPFVGLGLVGAAGKNLSANFAQQLYTSSTMALMVYFLTYLLATFVVFTVITVVSRKIPGEQIHSYAGLWKRSPFLAGSLMIGLISMAGVPPMIGFVGKLAVLTVAWQIGLMTGGFILFWVAVFAAVVGLYYYIGVVKTMFWSEPLDDDPIPVSFMTRLLLLALVTATILLGFWSGGISCVTGNLL